MLAAAVVDRRLPDGDGTELVAWLRRRGDETPILMLTALGETLDKVEGLDAGANDYLVKPFEFLELEARLRTHPGLHAKSRQGPLGFVNPAQPEARA